MADVNEVSKLTVAQLKELARSLSVEIAESDKKDDLVLKISDAITPEQLAEFLAVAETDEAPAPAELEESVEPVAPEVPEAPSEEEVAAEAERVAAENAEIAAKVQAEEAEKAAAEAAEAAKVPTPAQNANNDIATAIAEGFKRSKGDHFVLEADPGVEHRFTLVKNKQTGEVMIRENETGTLSKIQLLSIEEKEADIQKTEVEEL